MELKNKVKICLMIYLVNRLRYAENEEAIKGTDLAEFKKAFPLLMDFINDTSFMKRVDIRFPKFWKTIHMDVLKKELVGNMSAVGDIAVDVVEAEFNKSSLPKSYFETMCNDQMQRMIGRYVHNNLEVEI